MTQLNEQLEFHCPYARARQYLHEAIEPVSDGVLPIVLQLKATVPATNVKLAKDVRIEYSRGTDPMHFDEVWKVRWTPEPGGIYPSFEGELSVCAGYSYEDAILQLNGRYSPPLGPVGDAFDRAIGHRLASTTAQTLLTGIAAEMQSRYNREEAQKKDAIGPFH